MNERKNDAMRLELSTVTIVRAGEPRGWSMRISDQTTVLEAVHLMTAFDCDCELKGETLVLTPRHPSPAPTADRIAAALMFTAPASRRGWGSI